MGHFKGLAAILLLSLPAACSFEQARMERDRAIQAEAEAQQARAEAERQRMIAVAAKTEAMREEAKAKALQEFMQAMLSSADPKGDGPDVTVREVLDRASEQVEGAMPDQPDTRASVHFTLAESYMKLGRHASAEAQYRSALELWSKLFGKDHPDTVRARKGLARALEAQGKNAEAEK